MEVKMLNCVVESYKLKFFADKGAVLPANMQALIGETLNPLDLLNIPKVYGNFNLQMTVKDLDTNKHLRWDLTAPRIGFVDRAGYWVDDGKTIPVDGVQTPLREFLRDLCSEGIGFKITGVHGVILTNGEFRNSHGNKVGKPNEKKFDVWSLVDQVTTEIHWGSGHEDKYKINTKAPHLFKNSKKQDADFKTHVGTNSYGALFQNTGKSTITSTNDRPEDDLAGITAIDDGMPV